MSLLGGRPRGFALQIVFVMIGVVECLSHSVPTSANREARPAFTSQSPVALHRLCSNGDAPARKGSEASSRGSWADWIVAEPPCGYGRATTLDGQSKVAIGFTTYVLARARSCSPRRASSASKASCRSGRAASIGARKAAAGGRDDDDGVPKHDREALLGWLRKPAEAQGNPVAFIPVPRCP